MKRNIVLSLALLAGFALPAHSQLVITPKMLKAKSTSVIRSADPGTMEQVGVSVGDQVSEGQALAKLDDEKFIYAWKVAKLKATNRGVLRQAAGEMTEKTANLEDGQLKLKKRLVTEQYVQSLSGRQETARGKLEAAELAMDIAKLDLEMAKNALNRRYFRSPINGIVLDIAKPEGQKVTSGDVVMTIASLEELSAEIPLTPDLQKAYNANKTVPVVLGPGLPAINATVVAVTTAAAKKGEKPLQSAQLIFPSLLPKPLPDSVTAVVPDDPKIVAPPAGEPQKAG